MKNHYDNIALQHLQCSGAARFEPAAVYDNELDNNDDDMITMIITMITQHLQCSGAARFKPAAGRQVCRRWKQQVTSETLSIITFLLTVFIKHSQLDVSKPSDSISHHLTSIFSEKLVKTFSDDNNW